MTVAVDTEGLHPASALCLKALQWLQEEHEFAHVLDIGCGNGLLSLVAASIWAADVLAVDISEKAVVDTARSAVQHGLSASITALRSDGFSSPQIRQKAPFDLILFNLLPEPIIRMAQDVKACLAPQGICALGGIQSWHVEETKAVYLRLGIEFVNEFVDSPWHCLIGRHKNKP